jgi:hypothetical protein
LALLFGLAASVGIGVTLYIRLAPTDPAVWHIDMAAEGFQPPENAKLFCIQPENRYGPIAGDPANYLKRLDAIALATPRTTRLAGSVGDGRITWVTRTLLIGYPDYTTAQVLPGPALCILGRQRFGVYDFGVNAARIGAWVQELLGLHEVPPMTGLVLGLAGPD